MITRELVKKEVDNVHSQYLGILYKIIKALETTSETSVGLQPDVDRLSTQAPEKWRHFIQSTYGCLADAPIERGTQGNYELREAFE